MLMNHLYQGKICVQWLVKENIKIWLYNMIKAINKLDTGKTSKNINKNALVIFFCVAEF